MGFVSLLSFLRPLVRHAPTTNVMQRNKAHDIYALKSALLQHRLDDFRALVRDMVVGQSRGCKNRGMDVGGTEQRAHFIVRRTCGQVCRT